MEYIEVYKEMFLSLRDIEVKYGLDVSGVDTAMKTMEEYRVTTPVVGNFSTGKSSMINAIIGQPLLSVEIIPETAVPTEVYYGKNVVFQYDKTGIIERKITDLPLKGLTIQNTDLVKIEYNNEFLEKIQTVSIVDLPGFDSNYELHNRAIDQYLPNSLAYLLVVSCDEPVLKESMSDLLKELKLHNMPVYVVMTKCNRLDESELEDCKKLLKQLVCKTLEREDVKFACIDSYGKNARLDDLKEILLEIQGNTETIFKDKYSKILRKLAKYAEVYLLERIDKKSLTASKLEEEQEKLQKKIQQISVEIEKEQNNFDKQATTCINVIRDRIKSDLESSHTTISALIENGSNVTEKINSIIRQSVMIGINTEFEPKLKKYVENVAEMVSVDYPNHDTMLSELKQSFQLTLAEGAAKTAVPVVLVALGMLINPIVGIIGGIVGVAGDIFHNQSTGKKRQKQIDKAADKIIEEVSVQTIESIESEIRKYISNVNEEIAKDIQKQTEVIEKALNDIKVDMTLDEDLRHRDIEDIEDDLRTVRMLIISR